MSKSDAETQSWLSFDTSKSERTYSPGNSSYGDPGNADHGALEDPSTSLDEFHSPNKETFGDLLSMVVVEPNLRPRFSSFDEESFLRSKVQSKPLNPLNPKPNKRQPPPPPEVLPDSQPLSRLSWVDTDAGEELTSTSVSLFAPNWWDRMDDGAASTPLHPSVSHPQPPTTPSQVLHDLYPNHKFPPMHRADSQSSDILLKTVTDEFVLLVGEGNEGKDGDPPLAVDTGAGDDVVDEEVKANAKEGGGGVEIPVVKQQSMSPIMKKLAELEKQITMRQMVNVPPAEEEDEDVEIDQKQPEGAEEAKMANVDESRACESKAGEDNKDLPPVPFTNQMMAAPPHLLPFPPLPPPQPYLPRTDEFASSLNMNGNGEEIFYSQPQPTPMPVPEPSINSKDKNYAELMEQLKQLKDEIEMLQENLKSKVENNKKLVGDLFFANRTVSETKALLNAANEKIKALESAPPTPNQALSKLQEELRLAKETKSELEVMSTTRVRTLTHSLEALEVSLRESAAQNERAKVMHRDEVDYLMEQLTRREKDIHSLSRSLTVAEVDSDWRRLLEISKAGNSAPSAATETVDESTATTTATAATKNANVAAVTSTSTSTVTAMMGRPNTNPNPDLSRNNSDFSSSSALEREIEAQKKDINSFAPSLSHLSNLSHFVDFEHEKLRRMRRQTEEEEAPRNAPASCGLKNETIEHMMSRSDAKDALNPPIQEERVEKLQFKPTRSQSPTVTVPTENSHLQNPHLQQHQGQLRNFHSSAIGNLLTSSSTSMQPKSKAHERDKERIFGLTSDHQHNRSHMRKQLEYQHDNLVSLSDYAPFSSESDSRRRQRGLTVHGVKSEEFGERALRPGRKFIEGPSGGEDGGFKGVLEGVYGTDDAVLKERQRSSQNRDEGNAQNENVQPQSRESAAGASPLRDFSPFSKPVGKFKLNRKSSAPFATEETVRKVRMLVEEEEKKLMDIGLNAVLLKSEADRIGRGKRTGISMRRSTEIEELLDKGNKESSRLRRSLKEKKETLGLS